ncbi:hypothetical protein PG990_014047 [Apiospora arundinis]
MRLLSSSNLKFDEFTGPGIPPGIRIPTSLVSLAGLGGPENHQVLALDCRPVGETASNLGIYLRNCGADLFVRDRPDQLAMVPWNPGKKFQRRTIYVMAKLPDGIYDARDNIGTVGEVQLITRSRISAMQIVLPPSMKLFGVQPISHYDSRDRVVFSTESSHAGWSVFEIRVEVGTAEPRSEVDCFFACFGWNSHPKFFVSTLVATSKCNPASLHRVISEVAREADDSLPWILEELEDFGIPMQGSVVLGEDEGLSETVKLTHMARKVVQSDLCNDRD